MVDALAFIYAAVVTGGGVFGYVSKGSVMSLIAGLSFGFLLFLAAYRVSQNPRKYHYMLGLSTVLATVMGYRFYSSGKFMPAGLVLLISSGFVIRYTVRALTFKKTKPSSKGLKKKK
ncbi:transmembrane proteins 14C-domain-containing protein [Chytridium lagenaria]|nr:transmembrane proteins 14C-domain-containing protein [Chytridium lagenaria]